MLHTTVFVLLLTHLPYLAEEFSWANVCLLPMLTFKLVCTRRKTYYQYVAIFVYRHVTIASSLTWVEDSWNFTTWIRWWDWTQHKCGIVSAYSVYALCILGLSPVWYYMFASATFTWLGMQLRTSVVSFTPWFVHSMVLPFYVSFIPCFVHSIVCLVRNTVFMETHLNIEAVYKKKWAGQKLRNRKFS